MTPSQQQEMIDLVQKAKTFTKLLSSGAIELDDFRQAPHTALAEHGITIPEQNMGQLKESINEIFDRRKIQSHEDFACVGTTKSGGCAACEVGLTVAFAAILILTVVAVAAAIAVFAPEVAASVAVAFLESAAAVKIVFGVIVVGAGALAVIVCTKLIKCK